jgi:membrane protein implicated in regulation of membrane protease activity
VGILAWLLPNFHWAWELMTFGLMAILVLVGWWYYSKHYRHVTSQAPTLNRRTQSYVGRVFTLTNAIVNGRGKIKVDDSFWTVTGKDCPAGSKVKVVGAKGLKLEVKVVDS